MGGIGSGRKPRKYPPEIVNLAVGLYRSGKTVREVQSALPAGYRAQTILERYMKSRRPAGKRNQSGPANHAWRGDSAGYQAVHLRLGPVVDHACIDCFDGAAQWSFIGCATPKYSARGVSYCTHPEHYEPRCAKCHHEYDYKGRRANGQWLSRGEVTPHA